MGEPNNELRFVSTRSPTTRRPCVQGFTNLTRTITVGQRLRRDDPLVRANPELFRTPMMPLP